MFLAAIEIDMIDKRLDLKVSFLQQRTALVRSVISIDEGPRGLQATSASGVSFINAIGHQRISRKWIVASISIFGNFISNSDSNVVYTSKFEVEKDTKPMHKLKVTAERIDGYCNQPILVGDSFVVDGGRIMIPTGRHICMWALQSMMPIFPLLQRIEPKKGDWTSKAGQVFVCPDPKGKVHYRIERIEDE